MITKDWWCEDMEHNALIVEAETPDDAAEEWVARLAPTDTWVYRTVDMRPDGTAQRYTYLLYDRHGDHVNDLMVKPWNDEAQAASGPMP